VICLPFSLVPWFFGLFGCNNYIFGHIRSRSSGTWFRIMALSFFSCDWVVLGPSSWCRVVGSVFLALANKFDCHIEMCHASYMVGERNDSPLREHWRICKYLSYRY
jgi:hypothetical protein